MTEQREDLAGVMRRIGKLLAIAEDPRADAAEASAAAGMAERIMRKYQIENADVVSAELKRGGTDAFGSADVGSTMDLKAQNVKSASGWAGILSVPIAELNDCQARYAFDPDMGKTLRFSGYKVDVEVCRFTYEYVVTSMVAESRRYLKENACTRAQAEAFRRGYIAAVCASLRKAKRDKDAEMAQASTSRDLVIVKESAVAKHFGGVKYSHRQHRTGSREGFNSGYERGQKLDVGRRGVGTTSNASAGQLR